MAIITKKSTGTDLSVNTAWVGDSLPGSGDVAQWTSTSLGGTLTGGLNISGFQFEGAAAAATLSGAHTVGSSGILFTSANNRTFSFSGTVTIGSTPGSWDLYNSTSLGTANAHSINIASTGNISGSGTLNINRATGSDTEYVLLGRTVTLFTGTLSVNTGTAIVANAATTGFTNATTPSLVLNGGSLGARTATTFTCPITIAANSKIGVAADTVGTFTTGSNITFQSGGNYNLTTQSGTTTLSGTLDLTSGSHSITTDIQTTFSGTLSLGSSNTINGTALGIVSGDITGSSGFTKDGTGTLRLTTASKSIIGDIDVNGGKLQINSPGTTTVADLIPDVVNIDVSNGAEFEINSRVNATAAAADDFSFDTITSSTNDGNIYVCTPVSNILGISIFPAGCLTNLNNQNATNGFGPVVLGSTNANSYTEVQELPRKLYIANDSSITGSALTAWLSYRNTSASPQTYNTEINVKGASNFTGVFAANGDSHVIITGNAYTTNVAGTFSLRGDNDGENELSGVLSGPGIVQKSGSGTWLFSGTNTYTGSTELDAGTLIVSNSSSFGANNSADITCTSGTTLKIRGGITLSKTAGSTLTITGTTVENISGINKASIPAVSLGSVTGTTTSTLTITADSLELDGVLSGGVDRALSKGGSGTLYLSNTASTYDGTTTATAGTLKVTKLANINTNSSLGSPALTRATITMGSNTTLAHVGTTADSTDRIITCNAASGSHFTLDSSGTGSGGVTYSSGGTFTFSVSGTHNLTFTGTNSATNVFGRTIADSAGGGAVSLYKTGSNTWSITGSITATGSINCSAGTFDFDAVSRTFSGGLNVSGGIVSIGNGFTIGAATSMSGGKITAVLTGANTLTVTSGATEGSPATLQPDDNTNGNNSLTGAVSISGCVDLLTPTSLDVGSVGKGRVLGTSNTVTVNNGGFIRTKTGTTQRGRARYYNLVLGTGSTLKIGSAA